MSAIAAYRTAILALLDDVSKTRYSDAQCDQGLRMALDEYTRAKPLVNTYDLSTDGNKAILFPSDFAAAFIIKVELENADPNLNQEIAFYSYKVNEQWVVETTGTIYLSGYTLIVTYSTSHYIDGLDSGAGTSIPAEDEPVLQIGAAGFAAQMRSSSRAETINIQPQVSAQIAKVAENYLAQFHAAIAARSGAWFSDPPIMQDISFLN